MKVNARKGIAMALIASFYPSRHQELAEEFLASAYVIRDVEDRATLDQLRHEIVLAAARAIKQPSPDDDGAFLNNIHRFVSIENLNAFRLGLYRDLNAKPWIRPSFYSLVRGVVDALVGNELAMQNRINFSIQMP